MQNFKHIKKYFLLFISLTCIINTLKAQNPQWLWAKNGGGTDWDHGYSVANDHLDNIIIRGKFVGNGVFGDTSIVAGSPESDYVAKYDKDGNFLWVRKLDCYASWEKDRSVAIDNENNIYLTGYFKDSVNLGSFKLVSKGNYDIFLLKLNGNGEIIWAVAAGGTDRDIAYSVVADHQNNILLTGYFNGNAFFDTKSINSKGEKDFYLAKYDHTGKIVWVKSGGSTAEDFASCLAVDEEDNVYAIGEYSGNATFDSQILPSLTGTDIFIAVYDKNGEVKKLIHDGGSGTVEGKTIAYSKGNVYISGRFSGAVNFGSKNLIAKGQNDVYLAKYNAKGLEFEWATSASGSGNDEGNSVIAGNDMVFVTGVFNETIDFKDTSVTTDGTGDAFLACYDSMGKVIWVRQAGSETGFNFVMGNSLSLSDSGYLYWGGEFSGSASFGENNLSPQGSFDMYVCKLKVWEYEPSSSIKKGDEFKITVYPNPASDYLSFEIPNNYDKEIAVSLYNSEAKLVLEDVISRNDQSINIQNLIKGLYILKVKNNQQFFTRIILIK